MPLPYHKLAKPAATIALKAEEAGTFPAVHGALLAGKVLTEQTLAAVSKRFGLSSARTAGSTKVLAEDAECYSSIGVTSVPSFVVSDSKSTRAYGWLDILKRFP
jgi:hypothetical protein